MNSQDLVSNELGRGVKKQNEFQVLGSEQQYKKKEWRGNKEMWGGTRQFYLALSLTAGLVLAYFTQSLAYFEQLVHKGSTFINLI